MGRGARTLERFHLEMYVDYWYAEIFAVMEGYEKLSLTIPEVAALCENPLYTKLRDYRAGVYPFLEKYFDDAIRELLADPPQESGLPTSTWHWAAFFWTNFVNEGKRVSAQIRPRMTNFHEVSYPPDFPERRFLRLLGVGARTPRRSLPSRSAVPFVVGRAIRGGGEAELGRRLRYCDHAISLISARDCHLPPQWPRRSCRVRGQSRR